MDLPSPLSKAGLNRENLIAAYENVLAAHRNIRLVVLDDISSVPAIFLPVREMISVCRRHDAMVFVDGAHTPGHVKLDIENLGADFYCGNLHKWGFVPRGCAVLWVHPDFQRNIFPVVTSRYDLSDFDYNFSYQGTDDNSQYYTVKTALKFYQDVGGYNAIAHYCTQLVSRAADLLVSKWGTKHYPLPDDMKVPFMRQVRLPELRKYPVIRGNEKGDITPLMTEVWYRFQVQSLFVQLENEPWVRISASIYNTIEDYEKLADAILTLKAEDTDA